MLFYLTSIIPKIYTALLLVFLIVALDKATQARPGDFDLSFGSGGKVVTPVGTKSSDFGYATALQPDGKIIVAGRSYDGVYTGFMVSRINTDGTLDTSFGTGGIAYKKFFLNNQASAVAIQADGKIIVGGYAADSSNDLIYSFTLVRFNTNGLIDNTFGTSGYVQTTFNNQRSQVTSLAIQSDGKIVAAGFSFTSIVSLPNGFAVARFDSNGQIDNTFGTAGKVTVAYSFNSTKATSAVIQPDGKILVGGYGNSSSQIIRLNTDGSFDSTFDEDGKVTTKIGTYSGINLLTLQTDGKIVAAGYSSSDTSSEVAVARYNPDGSLDTTFDTDGIVTTDVDNKSDTANAVKIQVDGKIVVGGTTNQTPNTTFPDFLSIRYNSNGSLDTSYNGSGKVVTAITPSEDQANAMVIQMDGKIVLVGYSYNLNYDIAAVRYNSDGSLDFSFGNSGISLIELKNATDLIIDIAVQPDNKIVAVGYGNNNYRDIAIARYNPNGSLDTSFGVNGIVSTSLGNTNSLANSVVIQPDGKILVGGITNTFTNNTDFAVLRYNSDGSLDTTFGTSGILTFGFGTGADSLSDIALQLDGKIVGVGYSVGTSGYSAAVFRLNSNGSFDTTFNGSGKVLTSVGGTSYRGNSVVIQPDGKIVVAGSSYNSNSAEDFLVIRYNSNGSLDTTFDDDGIVTTLFSNNTDIANTVVVQSDGKIVAAGFSVVSFALARYNPNGSLDATFDGDGKIITSVGSNFDNNQIWDLAIQPNGKIIAAGTIVANDSDGAVFRYNEDGSLDKSFGIDGKIITNFGFGNDEFLAVALLSDNKIIAAGYSDNGANSDFTLVRYLGGESVANRTAFDFDGDGKADVSVFRPDNGVWYLLNSTSGFTGAQFGVSSDVIVPADYDGDGKTDLAVYRGGTWYINRSQAGFTGIAFGAPDDIPQPADFDGDGKADLAVWRPSNGTWYVYNLANNQFSAAQFGASTDKPVVGDYDGDGKADYAVFRPSNGTWYLQRSTSGFTGMQFGDSNDKPVPADYDGDGKTDIAVYRPSNGTWYLSRSAAGFTGIQFGVSTDLPTPADYDGDGKADVAVFRNGTWYLQQSTNGFTGVQFGASTDKPVPNAFVP